MSKDNVSEFTGRKPTEFDSQTNIQQFNQQLAALINAASANVSIITVIGSLEIMKHDILTPQVQPQPTQGGTH